MFDSYNDLCVPTTLNLRSALDSEFNLFKADLEEEDKQKAREYRCSLNELPDPCGPDVLFFPQSMRRATESVFPELAEPRPTFNLTLSSEKRQSRTSMHGGTAPPSDQEDEFEDLDGSFISALDNPEAAERFFRKPRTVKPPPEIKPLRTAKAGPAAPNVRRRAAGVRQKPLAVCTCKKSKCLKLYCECFAKGFACGPDCGCDGCHNSAAFDDLRELVIQETLEKNPFAFKSKYKKMNKENQNQETPAAEEEGERLLHSRGCNCSKTGCIKKYCECYNAGTGCSRLCRCTNCKNDNIEIDDKDVKVYYDRVLRRRKKRSVLDECFQKKCEIIKKLKLT